MLIGFIDDTEIQIATDSSQPDIYVFGGFFLETAYLHDLQQRIADVKAKQGLRPWHPIKWNLKDLKKHYKKQGESEIYGRLMKASDEIRSAMLGLLSEFGAVVMACGLYRLSGTTKNVDCYRWAFENLLQRVGLMARGRGAAGVTVVADWPQKGVGKNLFDIYSAGYYHGRAVDSGQDYFSGPLHDLCFVDSLFHSSSLHCAPLQLADIVAGCVKDFLAWSYKGSNQNRVVHFFPIIVGNLYRNAQGQVMGCGLKVSGREIDLDAKIQELLSLSAPEPEYLDEIPF